MSDAMPIYLYGSDDRQRGVLRDVTEHVYAFAVNGAHTLSVSTTTRVSKEDRLVTMGEDGKWQEFTVIDSEDDDSSAVVRLTCERSEEELAGAYIESRRPTGGPATMLGYAFEYADPRPRWEIGDVEVTGPEKTQVWYHTNAREVMTRLQSTWGGEFEFEVVVDGAAIVRRVVHWRRRIGAVRGKRFSYGKNLAGISRSRGTNRIYTRVYGYGAGLAVYDDSGEETGGYSRRITFGDVNGGRDYVESDEARLRWGRPDGRGGRVHVVGKVEFDDEQDQAELLRRTTEWAEAQYEPQVTYTAKVADFERAGSWGGPTCEGDDVTVDDDMMEPPLLATDRVVSGSVDRLRPENTTYTIGRVPAVLSQTLERQYQFQKDIGDQANDLGNRTTDLDSRTTGLEGQTDRWNDASETVEELPGEWLQRQMDRINQEMNAARTYKFTSFEKGDIWANGPLTADGKPNGATAAIALNGLGFRISSKVQGGDFVWTTFGTGEGFTANVINVGTLRCGDNYLNLDTGEMRLALTAKVGGGSQTLGGYVSDQASSAASSAASGAVSSAVSEAKRYTDNAVANADFIPSGMFDSHLNMRNVASALTNGFVDKGLFIEGGHVVFNGDYVRTGVIESQNGLSFFDLNNGYLEATGSVTSAGQRHTMRSRLVNGQLSLIMDQTTIGSLATYTQSNNANVHVTGLKAFTTLVLSAPTMGVSTSSTSSSTLTWSGCMSGTINHVASVTIRGNSAVFDMWASNFQLGMLISQTNTADVTFTPSGSANSVNLIASVEPASELVAGEVMEVTRIASKAQLEEAAAQGRMIWAEGDEPGSLGEPVYNGEEWATEIDVHEGEPVAVALSDYVEAENELMQAEIEAIAESIGDGRLTRRLAVARAAASGGSVAAMRAATAAVAARTEEI